MNLLTLTTVFVSLSIMSATAIKTAVSVKSCGTVGGVAIQKYTLTNVKNHEVDVITYGATITAIRVPDKSGTITDIVLGFDDVEAYLSKNNPYFGATVGRVANRIHNGQFVVDGIQYQVSQNLGNNTLHGGLHGWNSKIWESVIKRNSVLMTLLSNDGDEGFPGAVLASVLFSLTDEGKLIIEMRSTTTKPTPINLTNHSYFNLAGHATNAAELYKHEVTIHADHWTVTDSNSIPTGEIRSVTDSTMDLRKPIILGDVIQKVPEDGYDYNFCLTDYKNQTLEIFAAKVFHPKTGRTLEIFTNQPGVQFYTSNSIPQTGIKGKGEAVYYKHGALCLETQNYPDAINHKNFPNSILRPHQVYNHKVIYKFGVQA